MPTKRKKDIAWGYIVPYIHYTRGARFHFYENCVHFLWFFLRIVENSGFPRWNIQISSKLISWNSLNIKSHHQLVNLHEFLEISSIEKNSLEKNFHFEVPNKVHLMIYVHFGFIMTFIVPSELSENTIIVVYTKSVSILSPTPVQTIIKINWKWIFHVMILDVKTWN